MASKLGFFGKIIFPMPSYEPPQYRVRPIQSHNTLHLHRSNRDRLHTGHHSLVNDRVPIAVAVLLICVALLFPQ